METLFGQTFGYQDLGIIGLLILLEGVLSIDNALVLALLAKRLPKPLQARALTYGLVGAFAFRVIAISAAAYLLRWRIVKLLGGGYLLFIAVKHLFFSREDETDEYVTVGPDQNPTLVDSETGEPLSPQEEELELNARTSLPITPRKHAGFWSTVVVIELTDIAFAIDSILAAIAVVGNPPRGHVGPHPKLWVVIVGGILGLILMRVAAALFIKLLDRFPKFDTAAYLLVAVIGLKLLVDWAANTPEHPHRADFHDPGSIAFWIFWLVMSLCVAYGFMPAKKQRGRNA